MPYIIQYLGCDGRWRNLATYPSKFRIKSQAELHVRYLYLIKREKQEYTGKGEYRVREVKR